MSAAAPPASRQVSAAIGIARVVCILGIVYVHAWTGLNGDALRASAQSPQGILRWAVSELLGLSAVPLLSIVSGWLVAPSLARRGIGTFYRGKARTIVAPMLAWNAIALVLVAVPGWLGWLAAPSPSSWGWTLNELTAIARPNDIDVQMPFLRDLFVCMLAAPLLTRLPSGALALVMAAAFAWAVAGVQLYLLLRPAILLFFCLGIVARRRDWAVTVAGWPTERPARSCSLTSASSSTSPSRTMRNQGVVPPPGISPGLTPRSMTRPPTGATMVMRLWRVFSSASEAAWALAV